MHNRRIVITGYGSCSAAGTTGALWERALERRCCLTPYDASRLPGCPVAVVGAVPFDLGGLFPRKVESFVSRHALLGAHALRECVERSGRGVSHEDRTGLIFGSASHGIDRVAEVVRALDARPFDEVSHHAVSSISNAGACHLIAAHFDLHGRVHAVEGSSSSGMIALVTARDLIRMGACDRVFGLVGEANVFPPTFLFYNRKVRLPGTTVTFFGRTRDPETRPVDEYVVPFCGPRDSDRGAVAEAGGALLLESLESAISRNASVLAEIEDAGLFFHADNYHGGDRDLVGLRRLLAGFAGSRFDSIYLPVTGCYPLDAGILAVCDELFPGAHAFTVEPIIGHTGAATSLLNAILAVLSINAGVLLPTKNLRRDLMDPALRLVPASEPVARDDIERILVVSAGWGGYNGACAIKRFR